MTTKTPSQALSQIKNLGKSLVALTESFKLVSVAYTTALLYYKRQLVQHCQLSRFKHEASLLDTCFPLETLGPCGIQLVGFVIVAPSIAKDGLNAVGVQVDNR